MSFKMQLIFLNFLQIENGFVCIWNCCWSCKYYDDIGSGEASYDWLNFNLNRCLTSFTSEKFSWRKIGQFIHFTISADIMRPNCGNTWCPTALTVGFSSLFISCKEINFRISVKWFSNKKKTLTNSNQKQEHSSKRIWYGRYHSIV